ncbi:alpha/beta fold hydrolase [Nocardia sp. NPDC004711]
MPSGAMRERIAGFTAPRPLTPAAARPAATQHHEETPPMERFDSVSWTRSVWRRRTWWVCPTAAASRVAERIPVAEYRELPGTPHMEALEQPALVAAALDDFLPADR